jgi:predicted anti-sigma-YlaC factor YlaD
MRCVTARKSISLAMDNRLDPTGQASIREHLQVCPSCRSWQQEQAWLRDLVKNPPAAQPSPGLYSVLLDKINESQARPRPFVLFPALAGPAWQRAAVFLLLTFSAALGFFLGGRLDAPATDAGSAAVSQVLNLDAFADAPADSFAAVYDKMLQGELR